jgi:hypothetical protein
VRSNTPPDFSEGSALPFWGRASAGAWASQWAEQGVCVSPTIRQRSGYGVRGRVVGFFSRLPRCVVGMEACATAHYWARELGALGHEVRLSRGLAPLAARASAGLSGVVPWFAIG